MMIFVCGLSRIEEIIGTHTIKSEEYTTLMLFRIFGIQLVFQIYMRHLLKFFKRKSCCFTLVTWCGNLESHPEFSGSKYLAVRTITVWKQYVVLFLESLNGLRLHRSKLSHSGIYCYLLQQL